MEDSLLATFSLFGQTIPITKAYVGVGIEFLLFLLTGILLWAKKSKLRIGAEMLYESMYTFFEDVVGKNAPKWIKGTVITIFFVVLFANLLSRIGDIVAEGFPGIKARFTPFSASRNGVFAMSTAIVLISLFVQFRSLGGLKFFHEYIPLWGKGYLTIDKGSMLTWIYYPARFFIKLADIVISLFIGFLDIIGTVLAKPISLAFRLYGNMIAGTTLLVLLVGASKALSQNIANIDFPVLIPLILFVQGLLVSVVQAFVVGLLGAIFIKMSLPMEEQEA